MNAALEDWHVFCKSLKTSQAGLTFPLKPPSALRAMSAWLVQTLKSHNVSDATPQVRSMEKQRAINLSASTYAAAEERPDHEGTCQHH